jgi:photosystem II stability/assembly factor-like uncharacterized protein
MKSVIYLVFLLHFFSGILFSQSWVEQNSNVPNTALYSVSAIDDHNVWICGASGTVLRTINGGTNWVSVGGAPIPGTLALYNIFGIDSLSALVTGSSSTSTFVYRTSNAGTNWAQVFTQTGGFIDAIWMGNAQAGFMYGDPVGGRWSLWGTINGGLTWDSAQFRLPQAGAETGYNNAFYFDAISQAVWFGTNNTRIYRSTNLIFWSTQTTTGEANSSALWFTSPTNGMTGGTTLLFTTNSGATWNPPVSSLPGTGNIVGITGFGSDWWVVRQAAQIYFTFNDGASWTAQYSAPAGNYFHITRSRAGTPTLYAVRDNGGISKATGLLLGINPVSNITPEQFSLGQNYPNPFNPSTNIKYQIKENSFVKLTIYDVIGREAATLVNEKLSPGTYEVEWDASNYPSGVYFYKLTASGGSKDFTLTKKMELIK